MDNRILESDNDWDQFVIIDYEDKSKNYFYKFINYERIEIISKLIIKN